MKELAKIAKNLFKVNSLIIDSDIDDLIKFLNANDGLSIRDKYVSYFGPNSVVKINGEIIIIADAFLADDNILIGNNLSGDERSIVAPEVECKLLFSKICEYVDCNIVDQVKNELSHIIKSLNKYLCADRTEEEFKYKLNLYIKILRLIKDGYKNRRKK